MKKIYLIPTLIFYTIQVSTAQLSMEVYDIFQNKCMSCHSNANQQGGLDLEGSGSNVALKALDVYNNIVGKTPNTNTHAITEGYQYIYKGRPDLSYIFRKINGTGWKNSQASSTVMSKTSLIDFPLYLISKVSLLNRLP